MSQGSRLFDEFGKLMNNAAGVADGVRREIETAVKSQLERLIADMDLVKREDYDALRELVQVQSAELKTLHKEVESLKGAKHPAAAAAAAKPASASAPAATATAKPKTAKAKP